MGRLAYPTRWLILELKTSRWQGHLPQWPECLWPWTSHSTSLGLRVLVLKVRLSFCWRNQSQRRRMSFRGSTTSSWPKDYLVQREYLTVSWGQCHCISRAGTLVYNSLGWDAHHSNQDAVAHLEYRCLQVFFNYFPFSSLPSLPLNQLLLYKRYSIPSILDPKQKQYYPVESSVEDAGH